MQTRTLTQALLNRVATLDECPARGRPIVCSTIEGGHRARTREAL